MMGKKRFSVALISKVQTYCRDEKPPKRDTEKIFYSNVEKSMYSAVCFVVITFIRSISPLKRDYIF
jgi:hypothetical protein